MEKIYRMRLTTQVCHIPHHPHRQKRQTNPICLSGLVIQYQLRYLILQLAFTLSPSYNPSIPPNIEAHTSKNIQVAKLMLPKIPDKASCALTSFPSTNILSASIEAMLYKKKERSGRESDV